LLGNLLIEGDGIAERAAAGVGRGGEEANIGGVATIDIRMGDAAEDCEVLAMLVEVFQVRRGGVIFAAVFREEEVGEEAEVIADAEEAARGCGWGVAGRFVVSMSSTGPHGIEKRERNRYASSAEEGTAGELAGHGWRWREKGSRRDDAIVAKTASGLQTARSTAVPTKRGMG